MPCCATPTPEREYHVTSCLGHVRGLCWSWFFLFRVLAGAVSSWCVGGQILVERKSRVFANVSAARIWCLESMNFDIAVMHIQCVLDG